MKSKKTQTESLKKIQTEVELEMKNLESWTGTSEVSLMNRKKEKEKRISNTEHKIETDVSDKEKVKIWKTPSTKHLRNLEHYKNTKSMNEVRGRRRNQSQRHIEYFQQNQRMKFP